MQRLPLATRPPVPFHDASSSCFVVPRGKAACCCGSLKQERRDRAAHFAVAAIAATGRTAAPFLAAALLLAAGPPGLPASIPPGFSNLSLLVLRITDVMHVKNADVRGKKAFLFEGASRCPPGRLRVKPNPSRRHPPTPPSPRTLPPERVAGTTRAACGDGGGGHFPPPTAAVCGVCPGCGGVRLPPTSVLLGGWRDGGCRQRSSASTLLREAAVAS
jgi:hypothetical protein